MSNFSTLCNVVFSFIGFVLGLSAGLVFYVFGNGMAVFWGLTSGCFAFLNLHLHCLYFKNKLEEWHSEETMQTIRALAAVLFFAIVGILFWYLFRIFYEHLSVYPIKDSLIIASVWTFMSSKWAFLLYRTSTMYANILCSLNQPLLAS